MPSIVHFRSRQWLRLLKVSFLKVGFVGVSLGFALALPGRGEPCSAIAPLPETNDRPSLVPGDRGADVRSLQTLLTLLGYYDGAIDGVFNDQLTSAVQGFQSSAGLSPSGQVNNETWAKLLPSQVSSETCVEAS
ncbi:MAG: peptidoglycan-binding domain-containing protein [Cyanobacteria bacterium P01_C01_bin.89]